LHKVGGGKRDGNTTTKRPQPCRLQLEGALLAAGRRQIAADLDGVFAW
jgi:hypothetical protein